MHVWTLKNQENLKKYKGTTRHGVWKARNLAMACGRREISPWQVKGEQLQRAEDQSSPWQTNLLARRAKAAKTPQSWRGTNPLMKKPQLAMANEFTREASWVRTLFYKSQLVISFEEGIISYQRLLLGHFRERKQGKIRETLRSKEHKDWMDSQDHWDIMACFHSISSFLIVRLPWQWVALDSFCWD